MANWYGIEGIKHIYRGDYSDPLVEYKGMRWTEWEIETAVVEDYKYAIENGDIDEDMTFEEYVEKYADNIKGMLDDWIWSQQEDKDKIEDMKKAALDAFEEYAYDIEDCLVCEIRDWADTREKVLELVTAFEVETEYNLTTDNGISDYCYFELVDDINGADWSDMYRFAKEHGIEIDETYMVYLQNETTLSFRDKETLLKGLDDLAKNKNTEGLYMIVCGMGKDGGEVKFEGVACERTVNEARVALNGAEHKNEIER